MRMRQENKKLSSRSRRLGDWGRLKETHERCYRFGVHLDALDELLVRESRVAEEDLHFLRISIVDCGEFLEYD